jgi:hypothetical protein
LDLRGFSYRALVNQQVSVQGRLRWLTLHPGPYTLLYLTVGYGYRTWLAGAWLAGLLALGTWVFSRAYPGQMTPSVTHPPAFHPLAYTVDVLIPIVSLGQQNTWQPQGTALYWSWALTAAGWVLTTAVVAGLTGILKRD